MVVDMNKFRFIPGAPPGVCAARSPARFHLGELCANCEMPITELDNEVWYCGNSWLGKKPKSGKTVWHENCLAPAPPNEKEALIQEGRNQVLYLLLCLGDENVAHDHWHPDQAHILFKARSEIVQRLKHPRQWPKEYPDFEEYTYTPG